MWFIEDKDLLRILHLYTEGMPINDINCVMGYDVEKILDKILPYL